MTARSVTASSRLPMCTSHTLVREVAATAAIAAPGRARLYHFPMAIETSPSAQELRATLDELGVEFLFAQFVDMHGKPNAKLVPVGHLDDLLDRRRRVRRLRRRRHRPGPARSRHRGDARRAHAHAPAVAAGGGALRLRRDGRGRAVALLPAHDPAQPARPRQGARLRLQDGLRARVLPRPPRARTARSSSPTRSTPRPALLRHARADALARASSPTSRATSTRSAGTSTPPTTRTPTASSSRTSTTTTRSITCDRAIFFRYMVESLAQERGLIATFMPKPFGAPDRQRLPHAHEPVGRRAHAVRVATPPTTRAASGSPSWATTSSAA